ncbi:glycosyltransferase family 2 protein [Flavobacterium sp.]|uniref:glycosyltransferase family 2 protein n=1 Tax=Flavobacterium sp. TaxID=239 RepID=UPI0038FD3140
MITNDFKVTVVMPVYNAAKYVEEALLSAIDLPEVGEIILIEDGSKDNSLAICEGLSRNYEKVSLYIHENNQNKGASESRNLGILKAKHEYVSFLDADDIYNVNRFENEQNIFLSNPDVDGVYSAVGYINEPDGKVFTLKRVVEPKKLFHYLLRGTYGHFHTNGITIKKEIFNKVGYFNPELLLHQDSEMWLKMAFKGTLVGGELIVPVALIRRHEGNRIWVGQNDTTRLLVYQSFFNWVINKKISVFNLLILARKISIFQSKVLKKPFVLVFIKNSFQALIAKLKNLQCLISV